jgi:hypothetical protein
MNTTTYNVQLTLEEMVSVKMSLEDTLKGWAEAMDHTARPMISAMRDGFEQGASEGMSEMRTIFDQWRKQMDLIEHLSMLIDSANKSID